jgi:WD40 repeat protein
MKSMLAQTAVAALIFSLQGSARSAEPQRTGKAPVSDNRTVVEIAAPAGAQIIVDGQDKKSAREVTFGPLKAGQLAKHELSARFSSGGTVSKTLLLRGGLRYRVSLRDPGATVPELVLQTGHFGGVWSVAFSPDGKSVLTGGTDNAAILWDAATATVVRRFVGHTGGIESVAFSRDGKWILTGSSDDTAILWDAATGTKLRVFRGGHGRVALSPDGRFVLMDSPDKTATLWDVATGKVVRSFEGDPVARRRRMAAAEKQEPRQQAEVEAVAFSADGKRVLTGEAEEQAILWDTTTGEQLRTFRGHRRLIRSVAFSPDGKTILTGAWDNTAILWDADTGAKLRSINVHARGLSFFFPENHYVTSVAFSPDGKSVLTGSWDCTAVLTNLATGKEIVFKGGARGLRDRRGFLAGWQKRADRFAHGRSHSLERRNRAATANIRRKGAGSQSSRVLSRRKGHGDRLRGRNGNHVGHDDRHQGGHLRHPATPDRLRRVYSRRAAIADWDCRRCDLVGHLPENQAPHLRGAGPICGALAGWKVSGDLAERV